MSQTPQTPVLQQPYVVFAQPESEVSKAVKDVSIVAAIVVVVILLIVVASVYAVIKLLRGVVDDKQIAPTFECEAWLLLRQQGYLNGSPLPTNPATGRPYTICEATKQAVADSQNPKVAPSGSPCPVKQTPPDAGQQNPYTFYVASQQCSSV